MPLRKSTFSNKCNKKEVGKTEKLQKLKRKKMTTHFIFMQAYLLVITLWTLHNHFLKKTMHTEANTSHICLYGQRDFKNSKKGLCLKSSYTEKFLLRSLHKLVEVSRWQIHLQFQSPNFQNDIMNRKGFRQMEKVMTYLEFISYMKC